jgi:hypothetical protein
LLQCRFGIGFIAQKLDAVFTVMDTNGDGVISPIEFLEWFGRSCFCRSCIRLCAAQRSSDERSYLARMLRRLRSGTKNIHGINQTVFDDHREGDDREAVLKLEESIASLTEIFENLKQDVCSLILA